MIKKSPEVALYFGSFNPVHIGHLIIANFIANSSFSDEVWFVVSPQNPFKTEDDLLHESHRKKLIDIAIKREEKLKSSDVEFHLPKPSYTINTLNYLKEKYPDYKFSIIMGSDNFNKIHLWKNYKAIIVHHSILIYKRAGLEIKNNLNENIKEIDAPLLEISSTQIRGMIKKGTSIKFLVPDAVKKEIEKNNYYK